MIEFIGFRKKTYAHSLVDIIEHKKANGTKYEIKRRLMVKNYKYCLYNDKIVLKSQKRFKSDYHNVYTGQMCKIAFDIHMEQTHSKYAKVKCKVKYKLLILMIMEMKIKQNTI